MTYNSESIKAIRDSGKTKIVTPIFQGIRDLKGSKDEIYNTLDGRNTLDTNYRNLGNAVNQPAGAEFTYNFWLYIDSATNDNIFSAKPDKTLPSSSTDTTSYTKDTTSSTGAVYVPDYGISSDQFVLFMRGSPEPVDFKSICGKLKKDIKIKCPLVKLENGCDVLTVEFNTVASDEAIVASSRNNCSETSTDWAFMNSYKLGLKNLKSKFPAKWFMVSVVIQDTYPQDPLPIRNKARCTIYINGAVQLDKYVDGKLNATNRDTSILRQNQGNLIVRPTITNSYTNTIAAKAIMMADLTYFNYVPTSDELKAMYNAQFSKVYAPAYGATQQSDPSQVNNFMNSVSSGIATNSLSQVYNPSSI